MKLKIYSTIPVPPHGFLTATALRVELDGMDITRSLRSVEILTPPDEVVSAKIVISVDEIEVDANVLATLQAHLPKTAPKPGAKPSK